MKSIIGSLGMSSSLETKDHTYSITSQRGEATNAKEYLFICSKSSAKTAMADLQAIKHYPANFHTHIPVEFTVASDAQPKSQALSTDPLADPQFSFVLCRVGTNRNGDNFTVEELNGRYMTAINKKVDLQHSQDVSDIVGGIIGAEYREDETGGRIECVGELYIQDSPYAQLAYKLMRRGIVTQVSMECDYEEGECSVCQKYFKSKAEFLFYFIYL
jgi:adenine-specific DNA-methyltransferase